MNDFELFGSSPSTVTTPTLLNYDAARTKRDADKEILRLQSFVREIPQKIILRKEAGIPAGSKEDPIMELFR